MPVVPKIERSVEPQGIPSARLNPSLPSQAFGGMEQSQSTAIGIAEKHYEKEKRRLDQAVLLDSDLKLSELATKIDVNASNYKGKEAPQAIGYIQSEWEKGAGEIEQTLSNDEQRLAFRNRSVSHWTSLNDRVNRRVATEVDQYAVNTNQSWILNMINLAKEDYDNPEVLSDKLTQMKAVITDFYTSRGMGANEIEVEYKKAEDMVRKSARDGFYEYLSGLIDSDSPVLNDVKAALEETKDGVHVNYAILDPKDRETAIKSIESWNVEAERAAKESLTKERAKAEEGFVDKMLVGRLTESDVARSILSGDDQWKWITRLREAKERAEKAANGDGEYKTDKKVESEIYNRIVTDPESISETEIAERVGQGLSKSASKSLIDDRRARISVADPLKTQQAKTAIKMIDDAKTRKLFNSEDTDDNLKQWSEYSLTIRNFIKNHPDDDPVAFVNEEILKPVITTWKQDIHNLWFGTGGTDEAMRQTKERIRVMSGAGNDKYKVGKEYSDSKGRRAKYLGNGQWQLMK